MTPLDDARTALIRAVTRLLELPGTAATDPGGAAALARFAVDHAAVVLSNELAAAHLAARIIPPAG